VRDDISQDHLTVITMPPCLARDRSLKNVDRVPKWRCDFEFVLSMSIRRTLCYIVFPNHVNLLHIKLLDPVLLRTTRSGDESGSPASVRFSVPLSGQIEMTIIVEISADISIEAIPACFEHTHCCKCAGSVYPCSPEACRRYNMACRKYGSFVLADVTLPMLMYASAACSSVSE
jgi:hypothetical protein